MLHSIQDRYGEKLRASDGEIGHVKDFYFDDKSWTLRYLIADTGGWLAGRRVLISPHSLGHLYPEGKVLLVNLTRKQIEESPSIHEHEPVTRQQEEEYHRHYGCPYYAQSLAVVGIGRLSSHGSSAARDRHREKDGRFPSSQHALNRRV
ncbi:MAG: PRC-barrel domain-containing protein [Chthoniobacterales bacterium]